MTSQRVQESHVTTEHMRERSRLLVSQVLRYIPPSQSIDEESDGQRGKAKIPDSCVFTAASWLPLQPDIPMVSDSSAPNCSSLAPYREANGVLPSVAHIRKTKAGWKGGVYSTMLRCECALESTCNPPASVSQATRGQLP